MNIIINTSIDDLRSSLKCNEAKITLTDLMIARRKELDSKHPRVSVIRLLESLIRKKLEAM
jgi:hypothetical protein